MDFGGTKTALAVSDLDGLCLVEHVLATHPEGGAEGVLARAISAGRALLTQAPEAHQLTAVGVSTIGIPRENRVELAPAIPGWEDMALAQCAEAAFGVPVRVVNDVKAAAIAESRWGALAGSDPAIYLNLGTGLAAAIVVGGRVLDGAHGAAGEIGYNLVDPGHVGLRLSARPMLEDTVSGIGLAASGSRLLGHAVTAREIFDTAAPAPELDALVGAFIDGLAPHLVNLVIAIDPARVAVGGGMVKILGPPPGTAGAGARVRGSVPSGIGHRRPPFRRPACRRAGPGYRSRWRPPALRHPFTRPQTLSRRAG